MWQGTARWWALLWWRANGITAWYQVHSFSSRALLDQWLREAQPEEYRLESDDESPMVKHALRGYIKLTTGKIPQGVFLH